LVGDVKEGAVWWYAYPSALPLDITNSEFTLPHDVSSQIRLSESSTNKWVRPEDMDSALQANGILVGSGT
jgi:hypothetical protein